MGCSHILIKDSIEYSYIPTCCCGDSENTTLNRFPLVFVFFFFGSLLADRLNFPTLASVCMFLNSRRNIKCQQSNMVLPSSIESRRLFVASAYVLVQFFFFNCLEILVSRVVQDCFRDIHRACILICYHVLLNAGKHLLLYFFR